MAKNNSIVCAWGQARIFVGKPALDGKTITPLAKMVDIGKAEEGTTKLESSKGDTKKLTAEGGIVVAQRTAPSSYIASADFFILRGVQLPRMLKPEAGGVVSGQVSLRIVGDDAEGMGLYIPRCTVTTEMKYSGDKGILLGMTFTPQLGTAADAQQVWFVDGDTLFDPFSVATPA